MLLWHFLTWAYPYDLIVAASIASLAACWPDPDPDDGHRHWTIPK